MRPFSCQNIFCLFRIMRHLLPPVVAFSRSHATLDLMRILVPVCCLWALSPCLASAEEERARRPVDGIMDNSFLIEEAYNQGPGIVQHIFNAAYSVDRISGT